LSTFKTASPYYIKVLRFFFDNHLTTIKKKTPKIPAKGQKTIPPY
jgi:hypothetical protein